MTKCIIPGFQTAYQGDNSSHGLCKVEMLLDACHRLCLFVCGVLFGWIVCAELLAPLMLFD